ncbi:MAG TPA: hypothetical protein VMZ28_11370 [Kofleriaceae bacterium]|nr:hypothetical protein [Kofleriaceae bacterium]
MLRVAATFSLSLSLSLAVFGCGSDKDSPGPGDDDDGDGAGADAGPEDIGPTYLTVTGTLVDFSTGEPIDIDPGITTTGLSPQPQVSLDGADFTLENVLENSTFHVVATAPEHVATVAAAVTIAEENVDGVIGYVVSEAFVAAAAAAFEVEPGTDGIVLARAVDDAGEPVAGIPAAAFELAQENPIAGPFFLDELMAPAPDLDATSGSGWVVFFAVQPGLFAVSAVAESGYLMDMPTSPIEASSATVAELVVTGEGEVEVPVNVDFATDVINVFQTRGCADCHSGNGEGKDLAGFQLDGGLNKVYSELMEEASNPGMRVNIATAEDSLLLRMPSAEDPPDGHPTVVFASPNDPDYLTLLTWIREGAQRD